jgi:hypothetical protein
MAPVVEHLPSHYRALSSNPSTDKKKKSTKDDLHITTVKFMGSYINRFNQPVFFKLFLY